MEIIKKIYEGKTIPLIPVVPLLELRFISWSKSRGDWIGQWDNRK